MERLPEPPLLWWLWWLPSELDLAQQVVASPPISAWGQCYDSQILDEKVDEK
jgi:hypothetical protein